MEARHNSGVDQAFQHFGDPDRKAPEPGRPAPDGPPGTVTDTA